MYRLKDRLSGLQVISSLTSAEEKMGGRSLGIPWSLWWPKSVGFSSTLSIGLSYLWLCEAKTTGSLRQTFVAWVKPCSDKSGGISTLVPIIAWPDRSSSRIPFWEKMIQVPSASKLSRSTAASRLSLNLKKRTFSGREGITRSRIILSSCSFLPWSKS